MVNAPLLAIGLDFLGAPEWTGVAALVALAAVATSIVLYVRGRSRRVLTYRVTETSLVSVHAAAPDKIRILYENQHVGRVHLVGITLRNRGNEAVRTTDFEEPLTVSLGRGATALTVDVGQCSPKDLRPDVIVDGMRLVVEPLLLNPSDTFTLTTLVADYEEARLRARIAGISRLVDEDAAAKRSFLSSASRAGLVLVVIPSALLLGLVLALVSTALYTAFGLRDRDEITLDSGRTLCVDAYRTYEGNLIVMRDGEGDNLRSAKIVGVRKDAC